MKKVSSKQFNQGKKLTERILKVQGKDYNTWLHAKHNEYVAENQDILFSALDAFADEEDDNSTEQKAYQKSEEPKTEGSTVTQKPEGSLQY